MKKCAVSCEQHDYIEIACLYKYRVKLTLKDRSTVEGTALDTLTDSDKREYLLIDNGQTRQIELNQLHKMRVLTANAQFSEVAF